MIEFYLKGNLSNQDKHIIIYQCQELFNDEVTVTTDKMVLALDFIDINQVSIVASIVLSVISLLLSIRQSQREHQEKDKNNLDRIRGKISSEMLKWGVTDFSINHVKKFTQFVDGNKDAHSRIVITADSSIFHVLLSKQGDVDVIQIA